MGRHQRRPSKLAATQAASLLRRDLSPRRDLGPYAKLCRTEGPAYCFQRCELATPWRQINPCSKQEALDKHRHASDDCQHDRCRECLSAGPALRAASISVIETSRLPSVNAAVVTRAKIHRSYYWLRCDAGLCLGTSRLCECWRSHLAPVCPLHIRQSRKRMSQIPIPKAPPPRIQRRTRCVTTKRAS